jgi:hypothetical protein
VNKLTKRGGKRDGSGRRQVCKNPKNINIIMDRATWDNIPSPKAKNIRQIVEEKWGTVDN